MRKAIHNKNNVFELYKILYHAKSRILIIK